MKSIRTWLTSAFALIALTLTSTIVSAENMKTLGAMDVHYMAIGATFLTPQVAKAYGIERSKYNALINISVMDNTKANKPAKAVAISGTAQNLTGQYKRLDFEEVREGQAIYYLAQLNFRDKEKVKFELTITDGSETHELMFNQTFYVD
ncbi:DUF4426 domain-containing protein [Thalassotalea euphylliae]|uniref:DUF4426 domain-containing protein n=1 Tax=Thalassotalea euphylliae TaxID=1655234 RepID=A0A3E0U6I0_9GAMM|nr:DUF4426 domain-containing protein [Thalassotalea euphylliae]REL32187.1 DUF4426 domain-containing protein [Thalassotalea euphylliae]